MDGGRILRQPLESVEEFLARASPSKIAQHQCSWIAIDSSLSSPDEVGDIDRFVACGREELYFWEKKLMRNPNPTEVDKANFMKRIYRLAVDNKVVCGKWMLFPDVSEVDQWWAKVAQATAQGHLGISAKVAPALGATGSVLICVYCQDLSNRADCERVVKNLGALGLAPTASFKADALTYLNLYSGDFYRLKIQNHWQLHQDLIQPAPPKARPFSNPFLSQVVQPPPPNSSNPFASSSNASNPFASSNPPNPFTPSSNASSPFLSSPNPPNTFDPSSNASNPFSSVNSPQEEGKKRKR